VEDKLSQITDVQSQPDALCVLRFQGDQNYLNTPSYGVAVSNYVIVSRVWNEIKYLNGRESSQVIEYIGFNLLLGKLYLLHVCRLDIHSTEATTLKHLKGTDKVFRKVTNHMK